MVRGGLYLSMSDQGRRSELYRSRLLYVSNTWNIFRDIMAVTVAYSVSHDISKNIPCVSLMMYKLKNNQIEILSKQF